MLYLTRYLFYGIPIAAVLFFAISLYRFCYAKKRNKAKPDAFRTEELKKRKILLIVSSVIAGMLVLVVVGFAILLYMAVAFM